MNVLALSSWFPYPPDNGSRVRAFFLLRELARRGHRVRLVAGAQEESVEYLIPEPLSEICESVTAVPWRWYEARRGGALRAGLSRVPRAVREARNPALTVAIAAEIGLGPDIVLVLERAMDSYLPDLSRLPGLRKTPPLILDQLELSGEASARRLTRIKSEWYWRGRLRRYRAITAVSEEEAFGARRLLGVAGPPVRVVPNGVDTAMYTVRNGAGVTPGRLIYTGSPTYPPNREAVIWFEREILPHIAAAVPTAHLMVTGRVAEGLPENPRVRFTGLLPDVRSALAEAAVSIVPLRRGGGTRLKILEAWAAGVPLVSTTVGAAGLEAVAGEHLLVGDTPEAFAAAVIALLTDPGRAARIAGNARHFVETRYDWGGIGDCLDALLAESATL